MKRNSLLSFAFIGAALLLGNQQLFTNIVQPPAGHTGAPGELTCGTSGCHDSSPVVFNDDFAKLGTNGVNNLVNGMQPNTQYSLTVNAIGSSGTPAYGFSITALDASGDSIGNFAIIGSGATTSLATNNGRQYIGHKNANSTGAWVFNWQSPATVEPAFFYLIVNRANGNNASSGDNILRATYRADANGLTVVSPTGIQNLDALADGQIAVFPNPVSDNLNLNFNLTENQNVVAGIYNLNGQLVKPLMNEELSWGEHDRSFNVAGEMSTGIYLVKFTVGSQDYFKKIVVE